MLSLKSGFMRSPSGGMYDEGRFGKINENNILQPPALK